MVWAGIFHDGRTQLKIVQETLNAIKYRDDTLDPIVLPKNTDVILVQKVLTNTSHVTSCIVMLKDMIKVSLLQKGQNDRIKSIVSVFYGLHTWLHILFSYEFRFSLRLSDGRYRVYR
jgi:hypothetical protein